MVSGLRGITCVGADAVEWRFVHKGDFSIQAIRLFYGSNLAVDFQNGWRGPQDDTQCLMTPIPAGTSYNDGKWHHVAITRTADFTVSLYWDGVLLRSKTLTKNQTIPSTVRLGVGGQDSGNNVCGQFDELAVYDQALTAGQVVQAYYSDRPEFVVDDDGRFIVDVAAGQVVTNELSYPNGPALVKTGAGKALMYHSSGDFAGAVAVSNGWMRTGENGTFRSASSFTVENGATLEFGRSGEYAAPFVGVGTLMFSGVSDFNLTGDVSAFTGLWKTYAANVDFPSAPAAASSLAIDNGGLVTFPDNTTLASLSGQGVLGGVSVPDGKTLTVGNATDTSYAGRLVGTNTLVKTGSGTLTLSGKSEFSQVEVQSGTLALKALATRARHAYWNFEDADDLGLDSGKGLAPLRPFSGTAVTNYLRQVDGICGKAIRVRTCAADDASYVMTDANADLPRSTTPYTFSVWLRPHSTTPSNSYVMRFQNLKHNSSGGFDDTGWSSTGWYLVTHDSGTKLSLSYPKSWSGDGGAASQKVTGTLPSGAYHDGKWRHVVFTLDANHALRLYWDGVKIGENLKPDRYSVSETARLQLGSYELSRGHAFDGDFDEVQYLDEVWTDTQVAAEYASRGTACGVTMPAPLAHWTFDTYETDEHGRYFKDHGTAGWDFYEYKVNSKPVECVDSTHAYGEGVNGGAAYVSQSNVGSLRVGEFVTPKDTFSGTNPDFTLSLRVRCGNNNAWGRQVIASFGSAQGAASCLRLTKEGVGPSNQWRPRAYHILPGGANNNEGWIIDDTYASSGETTPWTTLTCVNDASSRKVTVYRDGIFAGTYASKYSLNLDRILLFAGYWQPSKADPEAYAGFVVDDLRVYREKLTSAQVKRLVCEQAGIEPNGLQETAVSLAAGTSLEATEGDVSAASVTGAGNVEIGQFATFGAVDWTGFGGSVTGEGYLSLVSRLPAGVTVSSGVQVGGAVTDLAGSALPVIDTASAVRIAGTGVVRLTDAADASFTAGKSYVLARAGSFELPVDFSGWTVEPSDATRYPYSFFIRNGEFRLKIKGGGIVILLK